ncbi:HAMP domain-containing sensor histidine kinase [Sphingomonas sp. S6]|uniref:sensor histidine kinase n=1 Tax=Sphingomonas sp. S6 TaxID=3368600 RepID=UPI000FB16A51|nr:HAMP domain-containing sensor histidine kinase [uncultured Sphingomonas sp.]RTL20457.1 MAG: HAMP domain-containing histidine kinase [Sphingomonadaceae bacterium]
MKRPLSALVSIGGFGVAVATLSVATTAAIVILAPQPPAPRFSAAEAVAALRRPMPGFDRRWRGDPPSGTRVPMLEGLIASELGRSPGDIRVTWPDGTRRSNIIVQRTTVTHVPPPGATTIPPSIVLLRRGGTRFEMVTPAAASGVVRAALIGMPMTAFAASVRQADGRWLTVSATQPLLGGWQRNILIALGVSLLLLAPLAWIFARRMTRPFRILARAIDHDDTIARLPGGPRELQEAAAAITSMRNRLAIEAAERARMLTAIAHDLRTPLTGLRLRVEIAPEPQRSRMVADVDRMQSMIGEVLAFARDAAAPAEIVEVRSLVAGIVADARDAGASLRLLPGDDAWVRLPEPAFRRAVENLVRNAADYAGGGDVAVRQAGAAVLVSVTDTGPGIPVADRERLLLPFERGDASRNRGTGGAGLGLSIVHDFAAQHRGTFTLDEGPDGGTIATLRLPSA